ncbi:beta-ketoacyl-ACP synthase III [Schleiferia thermophila]|jgi:3-oxoacyl-[acyl-carrier-protein] synthase-3|uniref:beta-ketoacyl-ACP synthase III n=1 Tax=Schleiferia thermophila TaxID=884107 RepID=UPI0004E76C67|nr:beta-ketoacyl-ACP synthase III [Schleiferia thermophila]KFD38668.1 3-oxoacyl-ACP synthase [Schleiferia thermophila str. Yellowstone]
MDRKITAAITSVGGYVPEFRLTNALLETMVDTSDEWITTRTGIKERRILKGEGLGVSYMAKKAIAECLTKRGIDGSEIDLVIVSTTTPDMPVASTAAYLCSEIGAKNAFGFDLQAACSGFLYGLVTAAQFVETGSYKKVLLVGGDKMSSIIDYTDRTTCVIFGDGCGAVLLEPSDEQYGVLDHILRSDGIGREYLYIKAGGSMYPPTKSTVENREHFVHQEGQAVFKFAVTNMAEVAAQIMERNGLSPDDVAWLVPHQANKRIIDATAKRMNLDDTKVMLNIHRYGNTTNGTIPLLLWDYESKLKKGDNLILAAFGGGFTWGAVYVKWAYDGSAVGKPYIE